MDRHQDFESGLEIQKAMSLSRNRSSKSLSLLTSMMLLLSNSPQADEKESPKWDVSSPPGQTQSVKLDTTEGTWLSLDVSPDGRRIAFDMLGDIYLLDIQGGQATSLTSGLEWDMQPRFSPDGSQLAFTSDRGGGDNIWVMDLAKGESSAKALTKESFRLLNQPSWDPSGTHIIGRKHFTGTRSLGAGELWAYHVGGGKGVQLTSRKNDQLDLGEPVFSPDGRYVYYSLDATGGSRFQYNKDPNKGIYAIERLDRENGEVDRILSGAGGAAAPQPSPDGRYLAYVRRYRGKTQLRVLDLAENSSRVLFSGLDRDMQETWAIHGVYARYAWMPDSQEIVFWAGGKIWRLPVSGGNPREIPFRVTDTRPVKPAVRFPVEVAPRQFPIKAIRELHRSPSGKSIVFEALGNIWQQKGSASPKPLTDALGHEAHPRFVNETDVLYTHWDDHSLGSILLKTTDNSTPEVLLENGRFAEPVLSPDGRYLAYRRLGKNTLYDGRYTQSSGLYLLDRQTGQNRRLHKGARLPHFSQDSKRLFFNEGSETLKLVSEELASGKRFTHLTSKSADQILMSPDQKTAAFVDSFELFVLPYVPTGRTQELGAKATNVPVKKLSGALGAYFPAWSPTGVLTWSCGPRHWSYNPASPKVVSSQVQASGILSRPRNGSSVALVGAKIVTMRGQEVIENGSLVIQGDRIKELGPDGSVAIPPGAKVIDCRGKTVMPGLVDVHWHGSFSDSHNFPEVNYLGLSSLSFGVTTLHDPSNDTASVFTARELQMAGKLLAPRIFSTGTILYGAKAPGYFAEVKNLEDASRHLKRLKSWGAISVKSYNQPRRDQRQQILEAARQTRMMVVPEGGSLFQHNMTMVADGHTGLEHAVPVPNVYEDVVQFWSQTKVGYTPTLGVAYGGLWGENYWYVKTDVWDDKRLNSFVPPSALDPASRRRVSAPDDEYNHIKASAGARKLSDRGVGVNLGAHGQREGLAAHWELWMLEQGGMTPHQALLCGTINGARYLGLDNDIGSLEPGKLADIIVVDGDPTSDIRRSKFVDYTIQGGRVFEASTMREVAPDVKAPPKLRWRR